MSETSVNLDPINRTTNWRVALLGALALLGLGVLVALIVLQQATDRERDRAVALQQHTFEVVIRANQLSTNIAQAEAALGRYIVSADKTLGEQYADSWRKAGEHLYRLRQLTFGDPSQQARLVRLQQGFDARGKELAETALYSTVSRHNDAWGSYYRVRQSPARRQVETTLDQIVEAERVLLNQRTNAASELIANSSMASKILIGFGVLIVLGAVLLGWLAIQAEGERAAAAADASVERERAEQLRRAVEDATAQLREEAREREQAEAKLRQVQKMEAVGQLTGGIAHDFNNMLAVVLGGLELARRHLQSGGPDAQDHIEKAMEGANRAAALTRRLLAFSRSEPLLPEPVEAGTLISGMSDLLDRTLGDTVRVETRREEPALQVWIDRHQLENAILNLAVNARDAMNGRGTLTIVTGAATLAAGQVGECEAGDYVSIAVSDTGHGMTPEVLDRVFEPFFTTKPVGKGTGLGLSQIFGFVRQSGGDIGIETAPGQGTTVTVYLPRHRGAVAAPLPAAAPAEPVETVALDILVVEDDPRVLRTTVAALEELGHRVTSCSDPLQAPAQVAALPALDLIITDVLMPAQTGPEMIAGLEGRLDGVGVLFVTGFAGEADPEMFRGHAVLRKPYTMAGLARAIAEAMDLEAHRAPRVAAE